MGPFSTFPDGQGQSERTSRFDSTTVFTADSNALGGLREEQQMSYKMGVHFPQLRFIFGETCPTVEISRKYVFSTRPRKFFATTFHGIW